MAVAYEHCIDTAFSPPAAVSKSDPIPRTAYDSSTAQVLADDSVPNPCG